MSRYGTVTIASASSLVTAMVESADAADLQNQTNAALAALPAGYTVVDLTLAGSGDGHVFVVTIEAGKNADLVEGGFSSAPTVTCYLASDAAELIRAHQTAVPASGPLADSQMAGASAGTRFMGMLVKGTLNTGGGGVDAPLSSTFWVDPGTLATTRTGSDEAPFISLQEAYDATSSDFNISFLLVPAGTGFGDLAIPASASVRLSLVGMGASNRSSGALVAIGAITIGANASFNLGLQGVDVTLGIVADASATGAVEITDSEVDGSESGASVVLPNVSTSLFATNVIFGADITTANMVAQNVEFAPSSTLTIATEIAVDGVSNYYISAGGVVIAGGGAKVITELDT